MPASQLLEDIKSLESIFSATIAKIKKDFKRQEKIFNASDRRQKKEYDELQKKFKEVEELKKEIENTQNEIIFLLGETVETRNSDTGFHVKRVAEYSYLLAKYYGLSNEEAMHVRDASPLHDIGKIGIADAILNKPGLLTPKERSIMETHAEIGYRLLGNSSRALLKIAAIIAHEHHEKWDGTGYPRGLKGESIHIYGRIVAISDVFDALSSKRCYKEAWSDDKIFSLLKKESGKHFEPRLIEIFFDHIDEFLEIRDRFGIGS